MALLIPKEDYLSVGIHIGMKSRTKDMEKFTYKIRDDGLTVLNLKMLDERINVAAKFLSRANNILAIGRKPNTHKPIKKFSEVIGCEYHLGRFIPGILTNPKYEKFVEPDVILLSDPISDRQAMKEALDSRTPIVALCDTLNETKYIDLIIPCNNKGKKSMGMIYWLLAREILKNKGKKGFKHKLDDFTEE